MDTRAVTTTDKKAVHGMATPSEMLKVFVQLHEGAGVGVSVHLGTPLALDLDVDEVELNIVGVVFIDGSSGGLVDTGD
jgi:hypothetical protein